MVFPMDMVCDPEYPVVRQLHIESVGNVAFAGNNLKYPGRGFAGGVVKFDAFAEASLLAELVEFSYYLARVAPKFVLILFKLIEFFNHDHREDYYIIFERLYGIGAVKKYVGIQDEGFSHIVVLRVRFLESNLSLIITNYELNSRLALFYCDAFIRASIAMPKISRVHSTSAKALCA